MATSRTREEEEIWIQAVDGRVWFEIGGKDVSTSRRGQKIRMTKADRERMQEMIVEPKFDPFTNGTMCRQGDDALLSDANLLLVLNSPTQLAEFAKTASEVVMRRLQTMCEEQDVSLSTNDVVQKAIKTRFPLGGSQPVYDDMVAAGDIPNAAVM
jgi:hypothetical protein